MQQLKRNSGIVIICGTLLIWIIKFIIRPFNFYPAWASSLVGCAPNLIGSFLLPFGAYWLFKKYSLLHKINDIKITCWFGLLLVIVNEYLQLIPVFGRTFDTLDILASFAGAYTGYLTFSGLMEAYLINHYLESNQLV